MFQEFSSSDKGNLEAVLKQEVDCFNSVVAISEKVARQADSLGIEVLSEMVNYRKEWIEKIQLLEAERKELDNGNRSAASEDHLNTISKLASKLVKIDEKIYKNLEKRKKVYARQNAAIVGQAKYAGRGGDSNSPNKLNIIQE